MFQTISMWNTIRPDLELGDSVDNIILRGYNPDPMAKVFLTGEFAARIANGEMKPLSVGDIADRQCPTRRDLYYKKGVGRIRQRGLRTWGNLAGIVVEDYINGLFFKFLSGINRRTYKGIRQLARGYSNEFEGSNQSQLNKLSKLKTMVSEDPAWLIKVLRSAGGGELNLRMLHSHIFERQTDIDYNQLELNSSGSLKLSPNSREVGISAGVEPDFLIRDYKAIGDIKSGIKFEEYYLLTCAGYALAYENEKGRSNEINWGIVYFVPTRYPTDYVKPITCSQVYLFAIDDNLRRWFLDLRNQAYSIVSSHRAPAFPNVHSMQHCPYCRFKEECKTQGLTI